MWRKLASTVVRRKEFFDRNLDSANPGMVGRVLKREVNSGTCVPQVQPKKKLCRPRKNRLSSSDFVLVHNSHLTNQERHVLNSKLLI